MPLLFYRLSGQSVILSGIIAYRQMNCKWCKFGVKNQRKKESANKMKLTYTNVNGYLIPNLTYKSGEHLLEVDKAAREREEIILKELIYV